MTNKEIIKALEGATLNAKKCDSKVWSIELYKLENALDLITRQQTEIEQWKEEANRYQNLWCIAANDISKGKAEAYKEFARRLKDHSRKMQSSDFSGEFWDRAVLVTDIDNLIKEMVGENNA